MRVAFLYPSGRYRKYWAWARSVMLLGKALESKGIEIKPVEISQDDSEHNDLEIAAAVLQRSSGFDLIHNFHGLLPIRLAELTEIPIISTLNGRYKNLPRSIFIHSGSHCALVSTANLARTPDFHYEATIEPGITGSDSLFEKYPQKYLVLIGAALKPFDVQAAVDAAQGSGLEMMIYSYIKKTSLGAAAMPYLQDQARLKFLSEASCVLCLREKSGEVPIEALEAMCSGTPVVSSGGLAIAEMVEQGITGVIFDSLDGIKESVKTALRLDRKSCFEAASKRFDTNLAAEKYLNLYQSASSGKIFSNARSASPPWGRWMVLDNSPFYKVKRIEVSCGKRLSYQKHFRRREHWFIVKGEGIVTLDGAEIHLEAGRSLEIPKGAAHRIANPSANEVLILIETQQGDYFGEDDIVRLSDDFGRV